MKLTRRQTLKVNGILLDVTRKRIAERCFFPNLTHGSSASIDVNSDSGRIVLPYPCEKICVGSKSLAAGKNSAQAFPSTLDQLAQKCICVPIDISEECEVQWITAWRESISWDIFGRLVVENNESGEMERVEIREWYEVIVRVYLAQALGSLNQATVEAPSHAADRLAREP